MRHAAASATARMRIKRFFCGPSRPPSGFALPWSLLIAVTLAGGNALALGVSAVTGAVAARRASAHRRSRDGRTRRRTGRHVRPHRAVARRCGRWDACRRCRTRSARKNHGIESARGDDARSGQRLGDTTDRALRMRACDSTRVRDPVRPALGRSPRIRCSRVTISGGRCNRSAHPGMPASQAAPAATGPAPPSTTARRAAVRARGDEGLPPAARRSAVGDTGTRSPTARAQPAPRGTSQLVVSRTVQATGRGGSFGELSKSAQIEAIREEEVVLQKRIDELSEQVQRMQQDRIAELTAQVERLQRDLRAVDAAQRAAEAARRDAPWPKFLRWLDEFWPILVAVFVLTALIASILVWRRRRIMERCTVGCRAVPACGHAGYDKRASVWRRFADHWHANDTASRSCRPACKRAYRHARLRAGGRFRPRHNARSGKQREAAAHDQEINRVARPGGYGRNVK